jgi:hypothetical protein
MIFLGGTANLVLDNYMNLFANIYNITEYSIPGIYKILNDLSSFFSNFILTNSRYCSELTLANWVEFINIYSNNYLKSVCLNNGHLSNQVIDPNVSIKCLRKLISYSTKFIGVFNNFKLFSFFNTTILNIK